MVFEVLSDAGSLQKVIDNEPYYSLIKITSVRKSIQIVLNKNAIFGPSQNLDWYKKNPDVLQQRRVEWSL